MKKSESKYYNTASLMDRALLILLENKEFDYITIKELCEKAGVNRSTFYLHYENMNELLSESVEFLLNELQEKFKDSWTLNGKAFSSLSLEDLKLYTPNYSIPYLEFIKENKKVFMTAINQPNLFNVNKTFNSIYEKLFEPILMRFDVPKSERKYLIKFYIAGVHAIIVEWIKNDCKDEISYISNLIVRCINVNENENKR